MRATGHGRPGRAVFTSFVATADDAGLPDDPEFRSALRDHMRWAVDEVLVYSPKTPRFLRGGHAALVVGRPAGVEDPLTGTGCGRAGL
jgi:hypothetical protein